MINNDIQRERDELATMIRHARRGVAGPLEQAKLIATIRRVKIRRGNQAYLYCSLLNDVKKSIY